MFAVISAAVGFVIAAFLVLPYFFLGGVPLELGPQLQDMYAHAMFAGALGAVIGGALGATRLPPNEEQE